MRQILLFLLIIPIFCFSQCPDGTFTSQAEIDAFAVNFPNCTVLNSSLVISGDDITDLSGLSQITACTGLGISNNLVLENTDGLNPNLVLIYVEGTGNSIGISNNASLLEVSGLQNLVNQSGFESDFTISNNPMLVSVAGVPSTLNALSFFSITNNDALINLIGLENYGGAEVMTISDNDNLIDLTGLNEATVSELITISDNDALESFNGLDYLGGDAHNIIIENNAVLEDMNITNEYIGYSPNVIIRNNPSLSVCNANWVCAYLYSNGVEEGLWFPGTYENNAPGCNSNFEVEYSCGINSNDNCGYSITSNEIVLGETITANNEFATTSAETPSCNDITNRKDVWFGFDSGDNTSIDVFIEEGFYLQLWQGDCYDLTQVDNACGTELNDITVASNTWYFIQIWNNDTVTRGGESSWFDLTVQDGTLSAPDFQFENVKVVPNPVKNVLTIETNFSIEHIEIFNLLGQRIEKSNLNSNINKVDMSGLSKGLYLVQVNINGKQATYKVFKK